MSRKTTDPKLVALKDKAHAAGHSFDRWYNRLRRAFNAMEKERQRLIRLNRAIRRALDAQQGTSGHGRHNGHSAG
jgi:hypothetical protein